MPGTLRAALPVGAGATSVVVMGSQHDEVASLLATFTDGLYRSEDSGENWLPVTLPVGADARPSWLSSVGSSVLVAGRSCLALSEDAGTSWQSLPLPPDRYFPGLYDN